MGLVSDGVSNVSSGIALGSGTWDVGDDGETADVRAGILPCIKRTASGPGLRFTTYGAMRQQ